MLKRRDTKMSSKGKENVEPASIEQSQAEKPKELVTQILGERYMDTEKMQKFLKSEFGDDWKVQIKLGRFTIATPRALTEDEIEQLST